MPEQCFHGMFCSNIRPSTDHDLQFPRCCFPSVDKAIPDGHGRMSLAAPGWPIDHRQPFFGSERAISAIKLLLVQLPVVECIFVRDFCFCYGSYTLIQRTALRGINIRLRSKDDVWDIDPIVAFVLKPT
jgi:hypothetical protein